MDALVEHRVVMVSTQIKPDSTARRVALWRALHVETDARPLVFDDPLAIDMADPPQKWRSRGDMGRATMRSRASTVARSRFVEDVVEEHVADGTGQYVILGAGLDTFAQRRTDLTTRVRVFEVDQVGPQQWKRNRLEQLGLSDSAPTFVPVDFESGEPWWKPLVQSGFDPDQPAVVASLGVSMYLSHETNAEILRTIGSSTVRSTFVTTFLTPAHLVDESERRSFASVARGTHRYGTPWVSFYSPDQMIDLARESGFRRVTHVSPDELTNRYFGERSDSLAPSSAEHIVVATT